MSAPLGTNVAQQYYQHVQSVLACIMETQSRLLQQVVRLVTDAI
jgi:hypothetical protein